MTFNIGINYIIWLWNTFSSMFNWSLFIDLQYCIVYVSYREGGKGKRMAMRNARLKVQNCLLGPKAEVYIHIGLHNIYNMEADKR